MELLTVKEAAALLRLSEGTVREMGAKGILTEHRVGPNRGRVRFARDQVLAHIAEGRSHRAAADTGPRPRTDRRLDGTPFRHL